MFGVKDKVLLKKTSRSFYTKNRSLEGNDKVFSQGLPRLKAQRLKGSPKRI